FGPKYGYGLSPLRAPFIESSYGSSYSSSAAPSASGRPIPRAALAVLFSCQTSAEAGGSSPLLPFPVIATPTRLASSPRKPASFRVRSGFVQGSFALKVASFSDGNLLES